MDQNRIDLIGASIAAANATQELHNVKKQLKAAKQRELELMAVIENTRMALSDGHELNMSNYSEDEVIDLNYAWTNAFLEIDKDPSQALREHEAKALEEAADYLDNHCCATGHITSDSTLNELRRMAEERRKK